jgi:hypothetical protein
MYASAVPAGLTTDLFGQVWGFVQLAAVVSFTGLAADWLVDSGLSLRGTPIVTGAVGLYAGTWFWNLGGWDAGPTVGGYPLLPALLGALAVTGVLKLIGLAVAGPRW